MKLVRFTHLNHATGIGVLMNDVIVPLEGYDTLQDVIMNWSEVQNGFPRAAGSPLRVSELRFLAPHIPNRNVFCVGWNYLPHFNESIGKREGQEVDLPDRPTFFTKLPTTIIGHQEVIPLHERHTQRLDWEVELAVIIGRGGKDIRQEDALDHVFGYSIANDVSARDLQRVHGAQWFKGKSLDGTCPLGPAIVTADEIPDPQVLDLHCHVNGQLMQSSNTRHQIFNVRRVIAELSEGLTLLPGDVILTGTPEGIGNARVPPVYLKDGDVIECEIQNIGRLSNKVRAGL